MFRPVFLTLTMILAVTTQGCSFIFESDASDAESQRTEQDLFFHTVSFPGETLELIGRWYTGTSKHKATLAKLNRGLSSGLLELGTRVEIPKTIMTTDKILPVEFVKKNSQESSSPFILNTPLDPQESAPALVAPPSQISPTPFNAPSPPNPIPENETQPSQIMAIPEQIFDELKELEGNASPTPPVVQDSLPLEPIIAAPIEALATATALPEPTISESRRKLLEQMKGMQP